MELGGVGEGQGRGERVREGIRCNTVRGSERRVGCISVLVRKVSTTCVSEGRGEERGGGRGSVTWKAPPATYWPPTAGPSPGSFLVSRGRMVQ